MLTVEEALRRGAGTGRPAAAAVECRWPRRSGACWPRTWRPTSICPPSTRRWSTGYAVRAADLRGDDRWLTVGEEITAGRTPTRPLGPREAAAIMTGAPLPAGADAVVMIEKTRRVEGARR